VLLTIATTLEPATDLGYLLVKHPDRVHEFDVPGGRAYVFYPEVGRERTTAALLLEVDREALAQRGDQRATPDDFSLGRYVNDRAYAASSLLASAIGKACRTALRSGSKDRPALATTPIPLELRISAVRCRGGAALAKELFEPLGFTVTAEPTELDPHYPEWGASRYLTLTLTGTLTLGDALNAVYVLLPVMDDAKHYWVSPDEVDKLLRAGEGWLARHPSRELIARRYLSHRRALTTTALERLAEADDGIVPDSVDPTAVTDDALIEEPAEEPRVPLNRLRHEAVLAAIAAVQPASVLDLGCGSGALLAELARVRSYSKIVGVDVSNRALEIAARRLRLDRQSERLRGRIALWQTALTYRDRRLAGFDVAVLMEVIEHIDLARLPDVVRSVFGLARPRTVIVTTPNVEYNVRYPGVPADAHRHTDHRFEWSRHEFATWCDSVCADHGYTVVRSGVGDADTDVGSPTQMAVFTMVAVPR